MSPHSARMKQARFLARTETKKPAQSSLHRSVSASYYARFHFLTDEATKLMLTAHGRRPLRDSLARAFHHSGMKQIAMEFITKSISPALASGFNRQPAQQPLIAVASAFTQLQEAGCDVDYNRALRFTRRKALDLANLTDQAFRDWDLVRGSLQAIASLAGLPAYKRMRG